MHAQTVFKLMSRNSNGDRKVDELMIARAAGSKNPDLALLDVPELPFAVSHIWEWYEELRGSRTSSGFGTLDAISYFEIYAWAQLTGRQPTPFEVQCLKDLDALEIGTAYTNRKDTAK